MLQRHGWLIAGGIACVSCGSSTQPSPASPALNGIYTLRVESNCAALPPDVRVRTYVASIDGQIVTLSGATFWKHPSHGLMNAFRFATAGNNVSLALNLPAGSSILGIIEETSPATYFGLVGLGNGTIVRDAGGRPTLEGTFSAGVGWGEDLVDDRHHTGCAAGGHTATFQFTPTTGSFPPPGVAKTLVSVDIDAPSSIAPGQSRQLAAVGHLTDGSSRDVTHEVDWHTRLPSQALDLTATGRITGRQIGEFFVRIWMPVANLPGLTDLQEIVVVPEGTVRIAGLVTTGTPAQPIAGATVAVVAGASTGLSTLTDWEGRYSLYGVAGESQLRVSKAGYVDQLRSVAGSSHQNLPVELPLAAPLPNVSGTYTLTITADPRCEAPMPEPFNVRRYTAVITQTGRLLNVALSGPSFYIIGTRGAGFPGQADPQQLTFESTDDGLFDLGQNPNVVEQLGDRRVLFVLGRITTDVTPTRLTGTLSGRLQFGDLAPIAWFFWGASCTSERHQVVFSR